MFSYRHFSVSAKQPSVISVKRLLELLLMILLPLWNAQIICRVLRAGEAELGDMVEISVRSHDSSLLRNVVTAA